MSLMSAPAAKTRGPPVSTTALTLSSASSSARTVLTSRTSSGLSALRTFGLFSVMVAIGASISTSMWSYPIAIYHRPYGEPDAAGLLRARRRRSPDLDHRPMQLPLHLLHAGRGAEVAQAGRDPPLRGDHAPGQDLRRALRSPHHTDHRRGAARPGQGRRARRDDQRDR